MESRKVLGDRTDHTNVSAAVSQDLVCPDIKNFILVGCAKTTAVGDPMEVVGVFVFSVLLRLSSCSYNIHVKFDALSFAMTSRTDPVAHVG